MAMKLALGLVPVLLLGACGSDGSSAPAIEITAQTRTESSITLTLKTDIKLYNIWAPMCRQGRAPRLQRLQDGVWVALRDDRPAAAVRPPHYLDGVLQTDCSLGCDGGNSCYDVSQFTVTTLEYEQVGSRQLAASETVCGQRPTEALPDIVSRPSQGPYRFELSYLANGCSNFDQETTMFISVPEPK
jgi:hypothetical protein